MTTTFHRQPRARRAARLGLPALLCAPLIGIVSCGAAEDPTPGEEQAAAEPVGKSGAKPVDADAPEAGLRPSLGAYSPDAMPNRPARQVQPMRDPGGREVHGVEKDSALRAASLAAPVPRRIPRERGPVRKPATKPGGTKAAPSPGREALQIAKTQYARGAMNPKAKLSVAFGTETHDFGSARQGDLLEHSFEMQSTGTEDLVIRQVSPTCGCTLGKITYEDEAGEFVEYTLGDPIPPGRKITLSASLDTSGKRNRTNVSINIYNNDPSGLTQLKLLASITPFISATPSFVNFGDTSKDDTKTQTIEIRTSQGEKVMLTLDETRMIPKPAGLEIELVAVNAEEDGRSNHWRATVTAGPGLAEGHLGYALRLTTDLDQPISDAQLERLRLKAPDAPPPKYAVTANISGRVLGVLSYTPGFLSMGLVTPGQRVVRTVRLTCHDPERDLSKLTAKIQGERGAELVWADRFSIKVEDVEGENAKDVHLTLEGLPEGSDGSFRGELVIETGVPEKPLIDPPIRFSGVCRSRIGGG